MSTILVAAIIIAIAVIPPFIFIQVSNKSKKKRNAELFNLFKLACTRHGIFCSDKEVLNNKIIGFDSANHRMLLFEFDNVHSPVCIDMAAIETCTVRKEYSTVNSGETKSKTDRYVKSILLHLEFAGSLTCLSISFYDVERNHIYEMAELETKANKWEKLLSGAIARTAKATG